ncbi:hypothetical protein H6G97_00680 [Nostoc flagelliforme FACHB-838]|uniref:Uncharacterized protein n=1 Tax=Nostoc flagelliforme FACHB-838 TaxID=2692904 RepID=A0ABR8DJ57_9NOSO|nr:hypothetical protein [Nostoc flagelliforme]MBD2528150.1 hypothetical protein [Nostoc flagelliforme FACHB-838]
MKKRERMAAQIFIDVNLSSSRREGVCRLALSIRVVSLRVAMPKALPLVEKALRCATRFLVTLVDLLPLRYQN